MEDHYNTSLQSQTNLCNTKIIVTDHAKSNEKGRQIQKKIKYMHWKIVS